MLVKLRRKFILITTSLVSLVLIAVFAASTFSTYQSSYEAVHNALSQAIERDSGDLTFPQIGGQLPDDFQGNGSPDAPPVDGNGVRLDDSSSGGSQNDPQANEPQNGKAGTFVPTYSVVVDSQLTIVSVDESPVASIMDDQLVAQAIIQASEQDGSEGLLQDLDLYYMKADVSEGTRIAFADASIVRDSVLEVVRTSLLIGAGALIALFLVSVVLSRVALRPVEEAWEQQKRFVTDASHELKTPLTVLLANNDILLSHPEKKIADQKKWLISTQEEAQRMETLVHDLLLLAQIEQSENDPEVLFAQHREAVDLSSLASKSVLQYEAIAFERSIDLESSIENDIVMQGDPEQLERLLKVLLDNACKYVDESGKVSLALVREKKQAVIRVSNTGKAIPDEEKDQIFERFYRSDTARSRGLGTTDTGGYGLGLSIAKGIVEAHDGSIEVRSTEGTTSFEVRFTL